MTSLLLSANTPCIKASPLTASSLATDAKEPSLIFVIIEQYEGEEKDGLPDGQGKARFAGRHTYEGGFAAGRMSGSGTYTWADGVVYSGEFDQNDITGEGSYTWPDGSSYTGTVLKGKRNGHNITRAHLAKLGADLLDVRGRARSGNWWAAPRCPDLSPARHAPTVRLACTAEAR